MEVRLLLLLLFWRGDSADDFGEVGRLGADVLELQLVRLADAELDAAVTDLVGRAGRGSALSKGLGKRGFYEQIDLDQSAAYECAGELMSTAAMTDDAQEGFNSFLEKRRAVFTQYP